MGRFVIIDQDKIDIEKAKILNKNEVIEMFANAILSPEETEQKFQQIYDQGYNDGVLEEDRQFNELKKTL